MSDLLDSIESSIDNVHQKVEHVKSGITGLIHVWILIISVAVLAFLIISGTYAWRKVSDRYKKPIVWFTVFLSIIIGLIVLFSIFSLFAGMFSSC